MSKFRTPSERPPREVSMEVVDTKKPSRVEVADYVPAQKRIEDIINAGQRLADYRRAQYHMTHPEEYDENFQPDPTLAPNFDLVDVGEITKGLNGKMNLHRKNVAEAKLKAEEAEKASQVVQKPQNEAFPEK